MYSLIIPAYNEKESIADVIEATYKAMTSIAKNRGTSFEILVINDGSTDDTETIVRAAITGKKEVRLINHALRRGVGAARSNGVRQAKGEKILFIDADTTYAAADLGKVVERLDRADMVIGARQEEKGTLPLLRRLVKDIFRFTAAALMGVSIPDLNSGLRGMDRKKTLHFLFLLPRGHSWVSTITLSFLSEGYTVEFVPISYTTRRGKSTFHIFRDTYLFFLTVMRTVVYFYPMRVIMPLSIVFFFIGLLFLGRDIVCKDIADTTVLFLVMSVIVFIFALLSEQLACLRREIDQRTER